MASDPAVRDLLVLGGGPSGSALAIRAACGGMRVLLIERYGYAMARPGEHIAGSARARLESLGVPHEPGLCHFSPGVLAFWRSQTPTFRSYGGQDGSRGFNTDRARLDAALFGHATRCGANAIMGEITTIDRSRGYWQVTVRAADGTSRAISAGLIADATGRRAAFLHSRGIGRHNVGDLFAKVTWLAVPAGSAPVGAPLTIGASEHGWWSLVDAGSGVLSLVVYGSKSALRRRGVAVADCMQLVLSETSHLRERLRRIGAQPLGDAIYPAFPSRAASIVGDGWLALGDAAVAFDPVSGQGVAKALEGAERAAELVTADPGLSQLGPLYEQALIDHFEVHLARRQEAYAESGRQFGDELQNQLAGATIANNASGQDAVNC